MMNRRHFGGRQWLLALGLWVASVVPLTAAEDSVDFNKMPPEVFSKEQGREAAAMIRHDIDGRTTEANVLNREQWSEITTRAQWEKHRDERLEHLRGSLGDYPPAPNKLNVRVTGVVNGDGFRIENLLYESWPGQWVPANLYLLARSGKSRPAILMAPRPLRLEGMVGHVNRLLSAAEVKERYEPAVRGYAATPRALGFADRRLSAAIWLLEQIK